jgi:hypothetical protein
LGLFRGGQKQKQQWQRKRLNEECRLLGCGAV